MDPNRWKRVDQLLLAALEHPLGDRAEFLRQACAGDDALEREVQTLLAAQRDAGSFLGSPAMEVAARAMAERPSISLTGQTVSHYRVQGKLGSGGMGVVYKAEDIRLSRFVAIKFLPEEFARDPKARGRFEREARSASALNHPNICTIYEVEEHDGQPVIVMELLEGATLKQRIGGKPLPVEDIIDFGIQLADGLEAAHNKEMIHRDIKPANVFVANHNLIKILDFGLAKINPAADSGAEGPTQTLDAQQTSAGNILGTVAYMSPEQVRAQNLDARTDLFSFGVVLYEMATGKLPFRGESSGIVVDAILNRAPVPPVRLNPDLPAELDRIIDKCLEKDCSLRYQHASEIRSDLKRLKRDSGSERELAATKPPAAIVNRNRRKLALPAAVAVAILAAGIIYFNRASKPRTQVLRLSVDLGENASINAVRGASIALSPDGSRLVYVVGQPMVKSQLAALQLDQPKAVTLAGTEGGEAPFFSPDGKSIGFFADKKLKRLDLGGVEPVTLCDAPSSREGSWGDDGNIVFAPLNVGGLSRVPSSGGTPQVVTELDREHNEFTHRYPQVLPGSSAVLFMNGGDDATGDGAIEAFSFKTGKRKVLIQAGAYGRYLPSGHLVYMHGGTLFAAPMDVDRVELTSTAIPILEDVTFHPGSGAAGFTFSQSGTFVYVAAAQQKQPIVLIDEKGTTEPLPIPMARYSRPRPSPDGTRLAVAVKEGSAAHIWIFDRGSLRFSQFPFQGNSNFPIWTPDGKYLIFSTDAPTPGPGIYWMRSDGVGMPQRLVEGTHLVPTSFSAAASRLLYEVQAAGPRSGVWTMPVSWREAKFGTPERLEPSAEAPASVSPDGRWLIYGGGAGTPQVFVRPFSGAGGPWQISNGGNMGVWSPGTREIFYQAKPDFRLMVASYSAAGDSFSPDPPRVWNQIKVDSFDIMPDGKRIVAFPGPSQKEPNHAIFLLNSMDDLRRRLPAKN
jgi:serine/threonine protein kinase